MKSLVLTLLLAAAALAQVPAKSTVGNTTIWVAELAIPLPYSVDATMTSISACSLDQVTGFNFVIFYDSVYVDGTAITANYQMQPLTVVKTELGYCGSVIVPVSKQKINRVMADQTRTLDLKPATQAIPSTSGNMAGKPRF